MRDAKLTLLNLQVQVEFLQPLEDSFGAFGVKMMVRGGDEEVIHVNDEPSFSNHVPE